MNLCARELALLITALDAMEEPDCYGVESVMADKVDAFDSPARLALHGALRTRLYRVLCLMS